MAKVNAAKKAASAPTPAPAPLLDVESASKLRDPFEALYMGVLRTNDPLLLERGDAGNPWQLYRDLLRDGKVFSCLQKRKLALLGRPWQVEPVEKTSEGTAAAEQVTALLKGFQFDALCSDLLDALVMGFSVSEVIWSLRGVELVFPRRTIKRAQRRFRYIQEDENEAPQLHLLTKENMLIGEPMPPCKFIVHRVNPEDDNPYGTGLGLQLYWPVRFKQLGVLAWNKLNDRFGSPTPWGKYPNNATPTQKGTLLAALKAMSHDGVIATPEGMHIELLESRLTGSVTTQQSLVEYMDDWIAEVLLGQSPRGKSGGAVAAASNEREDVRLELSQGDSDLLSGTLNDTLIPWICDYNGWPACQVSRVVKKTEDKKAEADADAAVAGMGFRMTLVGVRAKYGEYSEEAPKQPPQGGQQGQQQPALPPVQDGPPKVRPAFSEPVAKAPVVDPLAGETDDLQAAAQAPLARMLDQLQEIVDKAQSLDEIRTGILGAFGAIDPDDLVRLMEAAFAVAALKGIESARAEA